jgi:hypothetical protein
MPEYGKLLIHFLLQLQVIRCKADQVAVNYPARQPAVFL